MDIVKLRYILCLKINERLARWKELMKLIESDPLYSAVTFKISGNVSAKNAFEKVSFHLEKIY
jgi:hypothetical protein